MGFGPWRVTIPDLSGSPGALATEMASTSQGAWSQKEPTWSHHENCEKISVIDVTESWDFVLGTEANLVFQDVGF